MELDQNDTAVSIERALLKSAREGGYVDLAGKTIALNRPVKVTVDFNTTKPWGIDGRGATLSGHMTTIETKATNRHLMLRDFRCQGLAVLTPAGNLYASTIERVASESSAGNGIHIEGAFFESTLRDCRALDSVKDGFYLATKGDRVLSSAQLHGCLSAQNKGRGIAIEGYARDVGATQCYFRDNQMQGAYFSNGMDRPWVQCGFENNMRSAKPGVLVPQHTHMYVNNNVLLLGCNFHDMVGGSYWAVALANQSSNPSAIHMCRRTDAGLARQAATGGVMCKAPTAINFAGNYRMP